MRFTNVKTRRIARLERILGNNYLEEVFGSQLSMSMLRPIRYHLLHLAILKKPGEKDRRVPNNSGLKYGKRVPRNVNEAAQFDQYNGNKPWTNEILK